MRIFILLIFSWFLLLTAKAQIVNIPDANFKNALINHVTVIDTNNDGEIQESEAVAFMDNLYVENKNISDLTGIEAFINIPFLNCRNNHLTSLTLSNLTRLKFLICSNNNLTSLNINSLPVLTELLCQYNQLTTLSLNGYMALKEIHCEYNQLTSLTISNLPSLSALDCTGNKLPSLSLSNLPSFRHLSCGSNQMNNLSLNNVPNVYAIYCDNNQLTSLPFLTPAVLSKLEWLNITANRISQLTLDNYPLLRILDASNNPIDSLRLKKLPELNSMRIEKTRLTSLTLDTLPKLRVLRCGKSDSLRNIFLQLPKLSNFSCDSTNLISIDLSQTLAHEVIITNNPLLQYINMRNTNNSQNITINFSNNDLLQFICVDSAEKARVTDSVLSQLPGQGVIVSTACNFTPSTSSTIKGTLRFDLSGNGCTISDSVMRNVRVNNNDGIYSTSAFTNSLGQYIFHTTANSDTVTIALEQPSWFNVAPAIQQFINIPNPGATVIADFCVTANGVHPDLEISLLPLTAARPGFDAKYRLVYRNKGNQLQSGTIDLTFEDIKLNFLLAIPAVTTQTPNHLSWSFAGLSPYASGSIDLTFVVHAPPVVNMGDILNFTAIIEPVTGDETPGDNKADLKQPVSGAFDPNDKDVIEGSEIDISKVGNYLNYIIRFQNTGNDTAFNVVIKDSLANNLNWNTLVPIDASHPYRTVINKGNKVEFIFENIYLPDMNTNEPASHGFVSFKIKPGSMVTVGETIYNKAEIYFDFNLPVITNTVSTTIINPKQTDDVVGLNTYPNPVKDEIWFTVKPGVQINAVNLYNSIGEKIYSEAVVNTAASKNINIVNIPPGILFLEVITDQGKAIRKLIRIK